MKCVLLAPTGRAAKVIVIIQENLHLQFISEFIIQKKIKQEV
jgi:hypothetical protein